MNVAKNDVAIILSEEGRDVMRLAAVSVPDSGAATVYIQDTDDLGLWVKAERKDGDHLLLIRWEYVL